MSEFYLIYQHFQHATTKHPLTQIGIGDDCAISHMPSDAQLVSCVDVLVAGLHFPVTTSPYAIGYKAVAVNLSDLAAMGATPYAILLGLSLPKALANDAWLSEFSRGLGEICAPFGVELIGGDTTQSEILTISITALGFIPDGEATLRSGAQVGDVICVSGEIGSASFALQQVLRGQATPLQSALDLPKPQITLGQQLRGVAHSMIDVSDGLAQDLGHILKASGVGAVVNLESIPAAPALQALPNTDKWQHQLNGGDDYQLCVTMSQENFVKFQQAHHSPLVAIGEIIAGNGLQFRHDGVKVEIEIGGYQHF